MLFGQDQSIIDSTCFFFTKIFLVIFNHYHKYFIFLICKLVLIFLNAH